MEEQKKIARVLNCPFCGAEMEHGFLYASQANGFPWLPDGAEPTRYIPDFRFKKKGGMLFGNPQFEAFEFDKLSFWVCKSCMRGIADKLTEWGTRFKERLPEK